MAAAIVSKSPSILARIYLVRYTIKSIQGGVIMADSTEALGAEPTIEDLGVPGRETERLVFMGASVTGNFTVERWAPESHHPGPGARQASLAEHFDWAVMQGRVELPPLTQGAMYAVLLASENKGGDTI